MDAGSDEREPGTRGAADADVSGRGVVIFDFDGTLADTVGGITATARAALLAHGVPEGELGDVSCVVGPPFPQAFSMYYDLTDAEAAAVTADYRDRYERLGPDAWPLFDGMTGVLLDLRAAGRRLAVASSKRQTFLEAALDDCGVAGLFDALVGKDAEGSLSKEDAIRSVLVELGVSAEDAVMVGDRRFDAEAARACGVPCVGVTYGGAAEPAELEAVGALVVADSVVELRQVLLGSCACDERK